MDDGLGDVLAPVRERYATWMTLDAARTADREEDGTDSLVRALPLLLRMERDGSPEHDTALALAATGCALLCLDPRSAPGGEWHPEVDAYCRGRIRKVTRRGRGAQWQATADLPGLTLTSGATEVRALVPGPVDDLDKRVRKLQVGGTDVPAASESTPTSPPDHTSAEGPVLRCVVDRDLALTTGKLMAQTGHAGMIAAALAHGDDPELLRRWHETGCPAHVRTADPDEWRALLTTLDDPAAAWRDHRRLAVRDAGYTEVDPGTITVVATLDAGRGRS